MDGIQVVIFMLYGFFVLITVVIRAVKLRNSDEKIFKEPREDSTAPRVRIVRQEKEGHDHISSMALGTQKQLEQLERLHKAGLYTDGEYKEKRREILNEL